MFEERRQQGAGVDMVLWQAGSGSPILYLHDEITVRPSPLAAALAEHHTVIAPVIPGFGATDRPDWVGSIRDVADAIWPALEALGSEVHGALLVGSSIGGWLAAELALRLGDSSSGVVMLGPYGLRVPNLLVADRWVCPAAEAERLLFADPARRPSVELDELVANEETTARYCWVPWFADPTLAPRLARLRQPTAVIAGKEDRLVPAQHWSRWQEAIAHCRVELVPGGHFVAYEAADEAFKLINAFLAPEATLSAGAHA